MIRHWLAALVAAVLLVSGCAPDPQEQPDEGTDSAAQTQMEPPSDLPAADEAAAMLAEALAAADVSAIPMQSAAAAAQQELEVIVAGMDDAVPTITVGGIDYSGEDNSATATLQFSFAIGHEPWTYETRPVFKWVDGQWRLVWSPAVVHPELTEQSRMRRVVTEPKRAPINDRNGVALVEEVSLYEVGIDKANIEQGQWAASARELATVLDMDPASFESKVLRGGERQFVIAQTLRQADIPSDVAGIPGLHVKEVKSTVGPSDGFAASLLGIVGTPTAEMIEESEGRLTETDIIGLSGLQSRYNQRLGGVPGVRVELVARAQESSFQTKVVFNQEESVGAPITLSLDTDLQTKAEDILGGQESIASIVAIDLATGGIAAAANSPASGTYPYATYGKYAPGSTFKVVSALAMVRKGAKASSTVDCTPQHTVGTYTFNNYPGYAHTGNITLAEAIAYSCNTAFTRASANVTGAELHAAAGSLGVGTDYDAGFTSYFGTVDPQNDIDRAASMIGQGQVTMSPMGMAAVAASVAKGETVVPWLVDEYRATPNAAPLTTAEAGELRAMMAETVNKGTATMLKGLATGAKSGTAQFGAQGQQSTHAWMIAYSEQYAVAAFVEVGDSGGAVAAPLIQQLLG